MKPDKISLVDGTRHWMAACLGLVVAVLALGWRADHARAQAGADANRFLFLVDVSAGMKKLDAALGDAVFDLIYSGARSQMTNGDTYGVWLVGETNDTSASVETWKQKFAVELAAKTALRVKESAFRGKSRLDLALKDASGVARAVGDVTVIVVSSGETEMRGTPFDSEINAAVAKIRPEMRKAGAMVNTVLVARDGRFVAWAVNSPEFLLIMPDLPPRPKRAPEPLAKAPVAAPPVAPAAPAVRTTPPKVASAPLVITRETIERDKQATRALATTEFTGTPSAPLVLTAAPPKIVAAPAPPPPATNAPAPVAVRVSPPLTNASPISEAAAGPTSAPPMSPVVPSSLPVVPSNVVAVASPPTSAVPVVVEPPRPLETNAPAVAAREPAPPTTPRVAPKTAPKVAPVVASAVTPPASRSRAWVWLGLGACLILALGLVVLMRRERGEEASLISRAAALERAYAAAQNGNQPAAKASGKPE